MHLGRGAFEQATATAGEERITAKQHAMAVVGNMAMGMTGHMNHIQAQTMPVDLIPVIEPLAMVIRHGVMFGAIQSGMGEMLEQGGDAAHMILVVVSQQDGIELQVQGSQPIQHGARIARVDHQAVIFVSDQPDVIVGKGRNCDNGIHELASL
jgi:hypothetical protein